MKRIVEKSVEIKNQADHIIYKKGLNSLLNQYAEVYYSGSYSLDLMLKKDLDISLLNSDLSLENFFELGYKIAALLKPHSMFFRNTKIKNIQNRPPESLYWAFVFEDWNLDLWLVPEYYLNDSIAYIQRIKDRLNTQNRELILTIKEHSIREGFYGKCFSSREVYQAVLEENIKSVEEFFKLMEKTSY